MKQAIISVALKLICGAYKDSSGELIFSSCNEVIEVDGRSLVTMPSVDMCSCLVLIRAINLYFYTSIAYNGLMSNSILKEYREFSGARESESGFEGVELSEDTVQWQAYRQEMLYYFWMANQEM